MAGRFGRSSARWSAAFGALVLAIVAGCATSPQDGNQTYVSRELAHREVQVQRGLAGARDGRAEDDLRRLACRIAPAQCAALRIYVVDAPIPMVRAYANGMLLVHGALFEQLDDEAELAFALAHEIAHLRLGHFSAARDPGLEAAADGWAAARLQQMGYRNDAGVTLLERLQHAGGARDRQSGAAQSRLQALRAAARP